MVLTNIPSCSWVLFCLFYWLFAALSGSLGSHLEMILFIRAMVVSMHCVGFVHFVVVRSSPHILQLQFFLCMWSSVILPRGEVASLTSHIL